MSVKVCALEAEKGTIDLRSYNFNTQEPVKLNGDWAFYWKQLYSPEQLKILPTPDDYFNITNTWNENEKLKLFNNKAFGYATYVLNVYIDHNNAPLLSLYIPATYCSYKLWINDKLFAKNGNVAKDKAEYEPQWLPQNKPFEPKSDTLRLILQVANFDHYKGGVSRSIELGSEYSLSNQREILTSLNFLLTGVLMVCALIFFALYYMRKGDKGFLYFSVFCFLFIYRIIGSDEPYYLHRFFPDFNWRIGIHFEYFTLFSLALVFTQFIRSLYPRETKGILIHVFSAISILYCLLVIFSPVWFFTKVSGYFLYILLLFVFYCLWVYSRAVYNKRQGAIFGLISILVIGFSVWLNILSYQHVIDASPFYIFTGFLGFIFFQSLILTYRFANSLKKDTEQAEEGARIKSNFLAAMSHEIRTPINGVLGMSELLGTTKLNELQKEYLDNIKVSGKNLLMVINDILDFSKIEAGNLAIINTPVNVCSVIDDVFTITSTQANSKNLDLFCCIEPDVPDLIWTDEGRLKQVLVNLVNNAVKFTDEGYVCVRVSLNGISRERYDLKFEVEDTGIGIPQSKLNRLFKPFSQVDSGTERQYGGTGLGLIISKKIVEILEGKIGVVSELGKGSVFYFNIITNKIDGSKQLSAIHLDGKKALVGLKYKEAYDSIKNLFYTKFGIVTSWVRSIAEFENEIEKSSYDLFLIDYDLLIDVNQLDDLLNKINKEDSLCVLVRPGKELKKIQKIDRVKPFHKPLRYKTLKGYLEELFLDKTTGNQSCASDINKLEEYNLPEVNILVAEDNFINQQLMQKLLEGLGQKVDILNNGKEVTHALSSGKSYDIIFMDMQMPLKDGVQASREIREMYLEIQPVIIALTANASEEDKHLCMDAGMNDFLSKPVKRAELAEKLGYWISSIGK